MRPSWSLSCYKSEALISITIFLKGLNRRKISAEVKADFRVPKTFSIVLSHFHSLDNKLVEFMSGLVILKKSLINH